LFKLFSGHHGASGQAARPLLTVSMNKLAIVGVLALAIASVVGKGWRPGVMMGMIATVRREGEATHDSFFLFF